MAKELDTTETNDAPPRRPNGAGQVQRRRKQWYGRIGLPDGSRPWIPLGPGSRKKAVEKLAALGERGRKTGQLEALIARVRDGMEHRRGRAPAAASDGMTVRELVDEWTDGRLYERYGAVNRLRPIASAKINAWTLAKHALEVPTRGTRGPVLGDIRVVDVTHEDVGKVMAALPRAQAAQTRLHIYQRLRRVFDLAEYPCRLREEGTNPVKRYMRPERDEEKLYCYLYPSELLALLRSKTIPIGRRVLYAIAVYTGLRKGSLYSLRWKGIDFDHGTISALRVKGKKRDAEDETGGRPIFSRGDASLMKLLHAWWNHCGKPGEQVAVIRGVGIERCHDEAQVLRADLRTVGVKRAILFSDAANVEPLRFHDCRSTFCTWARRGGKSDAWIAERTGHRLSGAMIDRYTRQAQTLEDLDYEPFPDISRAIPELACTRAKKSRRIPGAETATPPSPQAAPSRTAKRKNGRTVHPPASQAADRSTLPPAALAMLDEATELASRGLTAASTELIRRASALLERGANNAKPSTAA